MIRSLWLVFVYFSFVGTSFVAPFIATLGYVWVDAFQPQSIAYVILPSIPVAMVMGVLALGLYLTLDRRDPPPFNLQSGLQIGMAVWCTLSMIWAVAPAAGWVKWDWAFKTVAFAAFVPYVIRSRVQIEAFVQTWVFSLAANFVTFGIKVMISGGGYGMNLGLQSGNAGLAEGGLLSTVCLMTVPLTVFLATHSQLVPKMAVMPLVYWATAALAVVTAVGTYERSALVGLLVLGCYMWMRSKHKAAFTIVLLLTAGLVAYTASSGWSARMETAGQYQKDDSALVRLLVWKWTLEFSVTHPLGGGFLAYVVNHVELPGGDGREPRIEFGRAFHSTYFEMLGEQGWVGLGMFLTCAATTVLKLRRLGKRVRPYPELKWVADLSDALQSGIMVFMSSGAFVGLGFQPMFWYFISIAISLNAYVGRIEQQLGPAKEPGWRALAANQARGPAAISATPARTLPPGPAPGQTQAPAGVPDWRTRAAASGMNRTTRR